MKTDDLIAALANDRPPAIDLDRRLALGLLAGLSTAAVFFFAALGVRKDIALALTTWRFELKIAIVLAGAVLAISACRKVMRPEPTGGPRILWLLPLALAAAVMLEAAALPPEQWTASLIGTNAWVCLTAIPALAILPLAAILAVMRGGAPALPAAAGALAGLAAAAVAATLYGLHCSDDSPLFVATWYTLASIPVIGVGAVLGHWLLRW